MKFDFYDIKKCGYYLEEKETAEIYGIKETLLSLNSWAFDGNKRLVDTCTYQADNKNKRAFCFNMLLEEDDIFLITWNETETLEEGIASANGIKTPGAVSINKTKVPAGHIPGYPTYFWFIPSKNIFATIRFGERLNGHSGLKSLLLGFLTRFSPAVIKEEEPQNNHFISTTSNRVLDIQGYMDKNKNHKHYIPLFNSLPRKLPGKIDFLKENRDKIISIHKKTVSNNDFCNTNEDKTFIKSLLSFLGLYDSEFKRCERIKSKVNIKYTPTEEQLDIIIKNWRKNYDHFDNDTGFEIQGESSIFWLSHSYAKYELEVELEKDENGMVSLESLKAFILKNKSLILDYS